MFTAGEIDAVMTAQEIGCWWIAANMDDAIGAVHQAVKLGILKEKIQVFGLEEHDRATPEVPEYLFVVEVDGVRLASNPVKATDILPGRGVHGVDAVVHVLRNARALAVVMEHSFRMHVKEMK